MIKNCVTRYLTCDPNTCKLPIADLSGFNALTIESIQIPKTYTIINSGLNNYFDLYENGKKSTITLENKNYDYLSLSQHLTDLLNINTTHNVIYKCSINQSSGYFTISCGYPEISKSVIFTSAFNEILGFTKPSTPYDFTTLLTSDTIVCISRSLSVNVYCENCDTIIEKVFPDGQDLELIKHVNTVTAYSFHKILNNHGELNFKLIDDKHRNISFNGGTLNIVLVLAEIDYNYYLKMDKFNELIAYYIIDKK